MSTMEEGTKKLVIVSFVAVLIISASLFGSSWDTIPPNNVGIVYDMNVNHLSAAKVWQHGRYLVGLGRKFFTFPTTYESIRMGARLQHSDYSDVVCRSVEGLPFVISVAFQYKLSLRLEDLTRLYLDFGDGYRSTFARIAEQQFQDVCSGYTATNFVVNRRELATDFRSRLDQALRRVYASVPSLELLNLNFNDRYMEQIEKTQVAKQDVELANYEYAVASVDSQKSISEATILADITLRSANATATAILSQAMANANATMYRIQQQTTGMLELRESLQLETAEELLGYYYFSVLEDLPTDSPIKYGLNYPSALFPA